MLDTLETLVHVLLHSLVVNFPAEHRGLMILTVPRLSPYPLLAPDPTLLIPPPSGDRLTNSAHLRSPEPFFYRWTV